MTVREILAALYRAGWRYVDVTPLPDEGEQTVTDLP